MYFRCAGDYDPITVANEGTCLCQCEWVRSSDDIWYGYFNICTEKEDSCYIPYDDRFEHVYSFTKYEQNLKTLKTFTLPSSA